MAANQQGARTTVGKRRLSASMWAVVATAVGTAWLLYTGVGTGEWRGVVVSEVQLLVVGITTFFVLRQD